MQPKTAITRLDLSLTYSEFSLRANRKGFIGLQILRPVIVGKSSGDYPKVTIESVLGPIEDTRRNADGTYKRSKGEYEMDSFTTVEHGVEEHVSDSDIEMYGDIMDAEYYARERAINRDLIRLEHDIATTVIDTAVFTGALTGAVSTPWTTLATSTPITDIDNGIEACRANCGFKPNTLQITDYTLRKMARSAQVQDLLKYSGRDDPKNLEMINGIKNLLHIENIVVAEGVKNTADEGQTASFQRLWPTDKAMLCYVSDSQDPKDPTPTLGFTFMFDEQINGAPGADGESALIIEEYREEKVRGGFIRARFNYKPKIQHKECGYVLTNLTA